jgi:hypothetical protein
MASVTSHSTRLKYANWRGVAHPPRHSHPLVKPKSLASQPPIFTIPSLPMDRLSLSWWGCMLWMIAPFIHLLFLCFAQQMADDWWWPMVWVVVDITRAIVIVIRTIFLLFTFYIIVKWFCDITDSVWQVASVSVMVKYCCRPWLGVDAKSPDYVASDNMSATCSAKPDIYFYWVSSKPAQFEKPVFVSRVESKLMM